MSPHGVLGAEKRVDCSVGALELHAVGDQPNDRPILRPVC